MKHLDNINSSITLKGIKEGKYQPFHVFGVSTVINTAHSHVITKIVRINPRFVLLNNTECKI